MSMDHRYVFYNQGYSSIRLYSVAQVVSVWPLGAISVGSYILLTYPHHCVCMCVCERERERISLCCESTGYSRLILYISYFGPIIIHFCRDPGSFYWRMALKTLITVLGVIIATEVSLLLVQSPCWGWLSATPRTAACQSPLSFTISQSFLKLISIESMMPSNHLILCCPLFILPWIFPIISVVSNESTICIRWPEYWSFSFSINPSNEYSGLICFKIGSRCF